jgi:hypothetical protein
MGQAKLRGTFEQRKIAGIQNRIVEETKREEAYQDWKKANPSNPKTTQLLTTMLGIASASTIKGN